MNPTGQAVIAIRKATDSIGPSLPSFNVWIDGHRAGKVERGKPAEFTVVPGEHTVTVWLYWFRSRPHKVVVEPGSRTELALDRRSHAELVWKVYMAMLLAGGLVGMFIVEVLRATTFVTIDQWWQRPTLYLLVGVVVFAGYVLVTSQFAGDYWAVYELRLCEPSLPKEPVWE